jgi:DNA-binding NarL/FixJ family response regulator
VNKKKNTTSLATKITIILIVDDHPVVRDGLAQLINLEADFEVRAKACNIAEAVEAVKTQRIDLAIVDMLLKGETGIQVIKKIKALCPNLIVLMFSMSDELEYIKQAFDAGARGYMTKDEVSEKIIEAIRQVLDGKIYLSKKLAEKFPKHQFKNGIHPTKKAKKKYERIYAYE